MIRSLLIKLGMLAGTLAVVFWIGWPVPQSEMTDTNRPDPPAIVGSSRTDQGGATQITQKAVKPTGAVPESGHSVIGPKLPGADAPRGRAIDLNRASAEDLERLPGIGAVLAQRVIAYRQSVGRFRTVEELREVKGIGLKKFDRIRPLVAVVDGVSKPAGEKARL